MKKDRAVWAPGWISRMKVWAEAVITEIDRRRIVFKVTAFDEAGQIGTGTHERFLINTEKFLAKASTRGKE